jgi:capsular polysaccharide transport system permease protein
MPRVRFTSLRAIMALVLREMSTTYGRTPGGYIWAFAEPLAGIVLLTVIFSVITRTPALGDNFVIFFASGILPFMAYQSTVEKVGASIVFSKQLLAYPGVTYVHAVIARLVLNAITQMVIAVILIGGIFYVYDLHLHVDYLACFLAYGMVLALGLGIGLVHCFLKGLFPIWQRIWAVANRPMFIVSGIFFLIDPLPEHVRSWLLYNPVAHPIMQMRKGIYDTYDAPYASGIYVFLFALISAAFGLLMLRRYHKTIIDDG